MAGRSLGRAAAVVAGFYVLSNITGFIARLLINARFGAGAAQDAFRAAFVIPDLLFNVLAGGALASAFIPVYIARMSKGEAAVAWRLARSVGFIVCALLACLALLAAWFAQPLIQNVVARQFDADQVALTASLMRVMLIATVVFGASGLFMGLLQANGHFLAPAVAPSLYQLGMIIGATALSAYGIHGLALGVVCGALMHLGIQLLDLWRIARASEQASNDAPAEIGADLRQVFTLMPPRVLGLGAVQLNNLVNTALASGFRGGVSAFNNAFAILVLPIAAIGQAIGTVIFPAISAHAARSEQEQFARAFVRAMNGVIALSLPAAAGLIVLGEPLIRLLFERGAFDAQATGWVAFALGWLALGLPAHAALELVTRAFYALKDSLRPALAAALSVGLNIAMSIAFYRAFEALGWLPFGGLGLANALATTVETGVLYAVLTKRAPQIAIRPVITALRTAGLATLAMALVLRGWLILAGDGAAATLAAVVLGVGAYFGAALLLRSEEALLALGALRRSIAAQAQRLI
jgi:putative peptidoglycan lipid II flippase